MRAIFDAAVRIPQDLAIVGCGNFGYDDLLRIPLTSIDPVSAEDPSASCRGESM